MIKSSRTAHRYALGFLLACILTCATLTTDAATAAFSHPCMEDAPCWTWSTMGNHKRGITLVDGTTMVVGRCQFASAVVGYVVPLPSSERMRGDMYAIRHPGCNTGATLRERIAAYVFATTEMSS